MTGDYPSFLHELTQNNPMFSRDLGDSFQSRREYEQANIGQSPPPSERKEQVNPGTSGSRTKQKEPKDSQQNLKRNKYIPRACQDCQRRKVKCSGENVCRHCRAREVPCVYLPKSEVDGRRKRARAASPPSTKNEGSNADASVSESRSKSPRQEETSASIESKIAQLQEQVKLFSESARSGEGIERRRLTFSSMSSALYTVDLAADNGDDTDTFENGTGSNNLSLSAQLADLQKHLRLSSGLTRRAPKSSGYNRIFPLELPHPRRLHYLLGVYFGEMDSFFPLLDRKSTEARLFSALQTLGYSDCNVIVDVDTAHYPVIALLCSLLVLGECQDPEVKVCDDSRPGWTLYQRGRRLIQHCGSSRMIDIDIIRYHTLSALYMLDSELLQSASYAISTAVQLAMVARLNDQGLWGDCTPEERQARQRLWWTIYFLDRRIAQRNGTPYIIRDTETAVDEFEVLRDPKKAGKTTESLAEAYAENYLQSLVDFGKLWAQIWDNFYAASPIKGSDWKEVSLADTRILIFRRQLPLELTWDTDKVASYIAAGEEEPMVRRRLAIFIRTNLLRMIIRQNPVLSCDGDEEARLFCADLSRSSIDAIAAFSTLCPRSRCSGYFISTALVECIYHLVYILQDRTLEIDRPSLLEAFRKAHQLLSDFASTWMTARRALRALSSAIFSGGDANALFEALSKPQSEGSERLQDTPREDGLGFGWSPSGTNFAEMLLGSTIDFGSNADGRSGAPPLNQMSNKTSLGQDSRRPSQPGYTGESVPINYLPPGFDDMNLDYAQIFSNL